MWKEVIPPWTTELSQKRSRAAWWTKRKAVASRREAPSNATVTLSVRTYSDAYEMLLFLADPVSSCHSMSCSTDRRTYGMQAVPSGLSAVAREEERLTLAGAFGGGSTSGATRNGGGGSSSGGPRLTAEPAPGEAQQCTIDALRVSAGVASQGDVVALRASQANLRGRPALAEQVA